MLIAMFIFLFNFRGLQYSLNWRLIKFLVNHILTGNVGIPLWTGPGYI